MGSSIQIKNVYNLNKLKKYQKNYVLLEAEIAVYTDF